MVPGIFSAGTQPPECHSRHWHQSRAKNKKDRRYTSVPPNPPPCHHDVHRDCRVLTPINFTVASLSHFLLSYTRARSRFLLYDILHGSSSTVWILRQVEYKYLFCALHLYVMSVIISSVSSGLIPCGRSYPSETVICYVSDCCRIVKQFGSYIN